MFRFFGIGSSDSHSEEEHGHGHDHGNDNHGHDSHGGNSHGHNVEVHHADGNASEYDIGQVALDVLDTESAFVIVAPLAGVGISEIDIAVNRNVLKISGERMHPECYSESLNILVSECFYGPFSRSVILPENLAFNKITATMENNLLTILVPKLTFPTKSIKINKLES